MTLIFPAGDAAPEHLLAETLEHFDDAARSLAGVIREIKIGNYQKAKEAAVSVRDLKSAFQLAMEERTRVEKLGRQSAGIVHDYALDFDAARAEIGRRLARLRDAGAD
ncbi:MAG: hypothetical protein H5U17_09930 [Defluviimonas sp.]|nr:hypothetical protein [Defluviimonas sp.]